MYRPDVSCGPPSPLAVAVAGDDVGRMQATVAAAHELAARSGAGLEVLVAWYGDGPPPEVSADVTEVFPLGAAYAFNRCLAKATAERIVFVQAGARLPLRGDRLLRAALPTDRLREIGGLDQRRERTAVADARRRLNAARATRGLLSRTTDKLLWQPLSPRAPLARLPSELGIDPAAVVPLPPSLPNKTHFMYGVSGRLLHLYVNPSDRLRRALREREAMYAEAGTGMPELYAALAGTDAFWVVEEALPGERLVDVAGEWTRLSRWLIEMAGPAREPLDASPEWAAQAEAARSAVPQLALPMVVAALDAVGRWPARHMHGDLQPKNVFVSGSRIAALDWEGLWLNGVPGLDVIYLALFAHADRPDFDVLHRLAAGSDTEATPVRPVLDALGVSGADVRTLVIACLAVWTAGERRRLARLGLPRPPQPARPFEQAWAGVMAAAT